MCRKSKRDLIPLQLKILVVGCSSRFRYFPYGIIVSTFSVPQAEIQGRMEPWDISKATVARNAGLRNTRRVCVFHDNDQENEALRSGQLSAVCATDVLPCESLVLSPQSQYRPHRMMAVHKLPAPLVSRIIFSPLVNLKMAYFTLR